MGKNYKGGYKIISLLGISLVAGSTVTIAGIHKAIESSYRKPLLIEGIVIDDVEKDATWVKELKVVDGSFVIEIYGMELTITDEDEVTVRQLHVVKSITSAEDSMELDIEDGEEILLSSLNEDDTQFNLPIECYIVAFSLVGESITAINTHNDNSEKPYIGVASNKEAYIKRVGNMILVSQNTLIEL